MVDRLKKLPAHRFRDATPGIADRFLVEKTLFDVRVIERKHARVVALRCPECGRRGYCLRVCRRSHLRGGALGDELGLRWHYVAQLIFSAGAPELARLARFVRIPDSRRPMPTT